MAIHGVFPGPLQAEPDRYPGLVGDVDVAVAAGGADKPEVIVVVGRAHPPAHAVAGKHMGMVLNTWGPTHGDGSLCSYGFIANFLTVTEQIPVIQLAAEW